MSKDKTSNKYFGVSLSEITKREGSVIPNIIYKLTNYLLNNGLEEEGIFRINGTAKTVEKLAGYFDKKGDADLSNLDDPASVASLLKQYLRELPDTLIPASMTQTFVATQEAHSKDSKSLISKLRPLVLALPPENFLTLKYLCAFLVVASKLHSSSKMNSHALSTVFGPNIFKCGPGFAGLKEQGVTNCIVLQFINKFDEIFLVSDEELTPDDKDFTLERLREDLVRMRKKQAIANPHQHNAESPSPLSSSSSFNSTRPDDRKSTKGDGSTDRSAKENVCDAARVKRQTTREGIHVSFVPLMANKKRRDSLEGETVVLSNAVLSEISRAIRLFVFNEPSSSDESSSERGLRKFCLLPNSGSKKIQKADPVLLMSSRNTNNVEALERYDIEFSDEEEGRGRNSDDDDDDDDSVVGLSDDDDDDDDGGSDLDRTVINNKLVTRENSQAVKTLSKMLFSRESQQNAIRQSNYNQSSVGGGRSSRQSDVDNADVSFQSNFSDDSTKINKQTDNEIGHKEQRLIAERRELARCSGRKSDESIPSSGRSDGKPRRREQQSYRTEHEDACLDPDRTICETSPKHKRSNHEQSMTLKETFDSLRENLRAKRIAAQRPEDPKLMNLQQLAEEKMSLQKALLKFEEVHGRPNTSTTKGIMMPLYDRYRYVKRVLNQIKRTDPEFPGGSGPQSRREGENNSNLNRMSLAELARELNKTQLKKKNLQVQLQNFEQQFQAEHGRRVQKADQMVRAQEYRLYTTTKAKLKLIEVLISKKEKQFAEKS